MNNLQIRNRIIADINIQNIGGEKTIGNYLLRLNFELSSNSGIKAFHLTALNYVDIKQGSGRQRYNIGLCHFDRLILNLSYTTHLNVYISFDKYQLIELEKIRAGKDLNFELEIKCLAKGYEEHEINKEDIVEADAKIYVRIEQSKWLEVLKQIGFSESLLLEIETPTFPKNKKYHSIIDKFKKTLELLHKGEYTFAVNQSRMVLEGLRKELNLEIKIGETIKQIKNNPLEMNKDYRFLYILNATNHALQYGMHTATNSEETYIDYSQKEAQLIVGNTGLLVSYLLDKEQIGEL
ncbi:MAG: hypothetical protein D8M58_21855 [Calditrichaeota bacterium]|nr:MAG: hypothetical protein DWQ03_00620 [Calditrichota bacterium]MBL1208061.1 hypothetical protein [Calditrichota bacterium]NOG47897.1 hypothetical protein [Calditrichota bacterium]